jgi:hypothetical protein
MLTAGKKAKDKDEAWEMQETYKNQPHGWIQWKGTNVCMDIYCACGYHAHIDDSFAYHVQCPKCQRVYACNGHIELIELQTVPENCAVRPELDPDEEDGM